MSFPRELPCRVSVELDDGRKFTKDKRDYLGFSRRPMPWNTVVEKFRRLTEGMVTREGQERIESCVAGLERVPVEELCQMLESP
jgi:2-methylcitrate dehydratase